MSIHICVPVLRRYDLLADLLKSLETSTVPVDRVWIVNNGRDTMRLRYVLAGTAVNAAVHTPEAPLGLAATWNWFLRSVPEERIITNDDIQFAPRSIEQLVATDGDLVLACGFSCFLLRDSCIEKVGYFDEEISPGYAYYEDEDYQQRIDGRGTKPAIAVARSADVGVKHFHSATLKAATHEETLEHHRKFKIAQRNYAKKWGVVFP